MNSLIEKQHTYIITKYGENNKNKLPEISEIFEREINSVKVSGMNQHIPCQNHIHIYKHSHFSMISLEV